MGPYMGVRPQQSTNHTLRSPAVISRRLFSVPRSQQWSLLSSLLRKNQIVFCHLVWRSTVVRRMAMVNQFQEGMLLALIQSHTFCYRCTCQDGVTILNYGMTRNCPKALLALEHQAAQDVCAMAVRSGPSEGTKLPLQSWSAQRLVS